MLLPALTLILLTTGPLQDSATEIEATGLVDQGWTLLQPYAGDPAPSLGTAARARARAAVCLFEGAVELQSEHVRALWSLGHTCTQLATDARARGLVTEAAMNRGQAEAALGRAIGIDDQDPWCSLARGVLQTELGSPEAGLADLQRTVTLAAVRMEASGAEGSDAWLRFKALEWQSEALMRAGRFAEAREQLGAFHSEFSENAFPLHIALAECRLRERDLAGARAEYEAILELFPADHQAYALLGYVHGLLGDRESATARLGEALRRELTPGLYTRLWLWILATDDARAPALEELRAFVASPPSSLSPWDRVLGGFCVGEIPEEDFLTAARTECERRVEAGEAVDELLCEAWFYVGHCNELANEPERALLAHAEALSTRPPGWKWEWAFARLAHARLAVELGRTGIRESAAPVGQQLLGVHVPGEAQPRRIFDGPVLPGLLWLQIVVEEDGSRHYRVEPVLASNS